MNVHYNGSLEKLFWNYDPFWDESGYLEGCWYSLAVAVADSYCDGRLMFVEE